MANEQEAGLSPDILSPNLGDFIIWKVGFNYRRETKDGPASGQALHKVIAATAEGAMVFIRSHERYASYEVEFIVVGAEEKTENILDARGGEAGRGAGLIVQGLTPLNGKN